MMSTVTITRVISGRIGNKSVSITLVDTIEDVTATMDRTAHLLGGFSMKSLSDTVPPPNEPDNAELVYLRLDTLSGNGSAVHGVNTASSNGLYHADVGDGIDLYRADAGGIFAENATATTAVLEVVSIIEQSPEFNTTNVGFFAAFKPIS